MRMLLSAFACAQLLQPLKRKSGKVSLDYEKHYVKKPGLPQQLDRCQL